MPSIRQISCVFVVVLNLIELNRANSKCDTIGFSDINDPNNFFINLNGTNPIDLKKNGTGLNCVKFACKSKSNEKSNVLMKWTGQVTIKMRGESSEPYGILLKFYADDKIFTLNTTGIFDILSKLWTFKQRITLDWMKGVNFRNSL